MSSDLSSSEKYAIAFSHCEPKYYSRTPAVVHHLTYIELDQEEGSSTFGKFIRKRLSPYDKVLYDVLKQLAGQGSLVWATTQLLADMCNMSSGQVSKSKQVLSSTFEQLDGPLIQKNKRTRRFFRDDGTQGSSTYDQIEIRDIWRHNNGFMTVRHEVGERPLGIVDNFVDKSGSSSPGESHPPSDSLGESDLRGSDSPGERIIDIKDSSYEGVNASQPSASPLCGKSWREMSAMDRDEQLWKLANEKDSEDLRNVLAVFAYKKYFIEEIFRKFPPLRIMAAFDYVHEVSKIKGVQIHETGYMRKAVEGAYNLIDYLEKNNICIP